MDKRQDWLKKKINLNTSEINKTKTLINDLHLNTVCESAKCPNIFDCFGNKTATFMIMGDVCTRNCKFCGIKSGKPEVLDKSEPLRVAEAVKRMGLKYVVLTSVTRDDLYDGGSSHFVKTIEEINKLNFDIKIECLIPDFRGNVGSLKLIASQKLDVLSHNIETVRRNFKEVKKSSNYETSLNILRNIRSLKRDVFIKSGFMLGLGEEVEEIMELLADLKEAGCDIITIGQYLRPSNLNLPVKKYYSPEEFEKIGKLAESMGFGAVVSGIFVRSSYNAAIVFERLLSRRRQIIN